MATKQMTPVVLSGNTLKIIAAVSMLIDHMGMILFPGVSVMRVIGRLAFPIFAYLIYEGCRYTGNKRVYLARMTVLGLAMTAVQYIATEDLYFNVLVTFSCSVSLIFAVMRIKDAPTGALRAARGGEVILLMAIFFAFSELLTIDYGFMGIMLPVFPALADAAFGEKSLPHPISSRFLAFAAALVLLSLSYSGIQPYCLLSLMLIALYNGTRGLRLPKYAFYVFYPLHIAILWAIDFVI